VALWLLCSWARSRSPRRRPSQRPHRRALMDGSHTRQTNKQASKQTNGGTIALARALSRTLATRAHARALLLGSPLPRPHRDWDHPATFAPGPGSPPTRSGRRVVESRAD
jgi:hypothetical protein